MLSRRSDRVGGNEDVALEMYLDSVDSLSRDGLLVLGSSLELRRRSERGEPSLGLELDARNLPHWARRLRGSLLRLGPITQQFLNLDRLDLRPLPPLFDLGRLIQPLEGHKQAGEGGGRLIERLPGEISDLTTDRRKEREDLLALNVDACRRIFC